MSDPEPEEYRQYVNTLARLIETRKAATDEAAVREVDYAISRMYDHVVGKYGKGRWTALELDAFDTLNRPQGLPL
jgi:hypothetical protein